MVGARESLRIASPWPLERLNILQHHSTMDVWSDLISSSTVPPPAEPITLSDLSAQTLS